LYKQYLECGKIVTTHGIKGEVRVQPWCDSGDFLLDFDVLYFDDKGINPIKITNARVHKNVVVIKFENIDTVEAAAALRNKVLYINRDDAVIEDGEYFIQDLLDLEVIDIDTNQSYGIITDVTQTGANDVYHITDTNGKERLIPAIKDVVVNTDIHGGKMFIRPLEGLFDDEN